MFLSPRGTQINKLLFNVDNKSVLFFEEKNGNRLKSISYKKSPWVTDVNKLFSLAFF